MVDLRALPSVDRILQTGLASEWVAFYGHPLTVDAIRITLAEVRSKYKEDRKVPEVNEILERVSEQLTRWTAASLTPVINATGVIIHTNLGRAPLSKSSIEALHAAAQGYTNLEFDLDTGKRGSRLVHAEDLLKRLLDVEAALVVNNNAAAVLLVLTALAKRRAVVIARSQLVEIGGGFRVPDVMKQSGARLVEIGTTNRIHLTDYEKALQEEPVALVMRAHRSNFRIVGFTSEPELSEITEVSHQFGVPVVDDLGSGSLFDTSRFGLGHEPMVQESLSGGVDLVCFSGDKLLGGPQAGIIVGSSELVAKLKKHPLARAIRADKLCLAALSATLIHYIKDEALSEIPVWRMISAPVTDLKSRVCGWIERLGIGEPTDGLSTVGGGSLPGETIPSCLLSLKVSSPNRFLSCLRSCEFPIISRVEEDRVVFDPRTVLPEQDEILLAGIHDALQRC